MTLETIELIMLCILLIFIGTNLFIEIRKTYNNDDYQEKTERAKI